MIRIEAIAPWRVRDEARRVWPLIEKACSREADHGPAYYIDKASQNLAVMWKVYQSGKVLGVCFTTRCVNDGKVSIWAEVCGGVKGREWAKVLWMRLRRFAVAEQADSVVIVGRKGWSKWLGLTPVSRRDNRWLYEVVP